MNLKCYQAECFNNSRWACECKDYFCDSHYNSHLISNPTHNLLELYFGYSPDGIHYLKDSIISQFTLLQLFKQRIFELQKQMQNILFSTVSQHLSKITLQETKTLNAIKQLTTNQYISKPLQLLIDDLTSYNYEIDSFKLNESEFMNTLDYYFSQLSIKKTLNLNNINLPVNEIISHLNTKQLFPEGHIEKVTAMALTNDDKYLVSGSSDMKIKVWSTSTKQIIRETTAHTDWVNGILISDDSSTIVSCSGDKTIKLWSFQTLEPQLEFTGHKDWVNCIAATKAFNYIISGSKDTTLRIWSLNSKKCEFIINAHSSWVNGVAVTDNCKFIISCSGDFTVKIWDFASHRLELQIQAHSGFVQTVKISYNQAFFASGSTDGAVKVWNLLQNPLQDIITLPHRHAITYISITKDCSHLISSTIERYITVWNLFNRTAVNIIQFTYTCRAFCITSDSKYLLIGLDKGLIQSHCLQNEIIQNFKAHNKPLASIVFTKNLQYALTTSSDFSCHLWSLQDSQHNSELVGHTTMLSKLVLTSDSQFLFTKDNLGIIRQFKFLSPKPDRIFNNFSLLEQYMNQYPELKDLA